MFLRTELIFRPEFYALQSLIRQFDEFVQEIHDDIFVLTVRPVLEDDFTADDVIVFLGVEVVDDVELLHEGKIVLLLLTHWVFDLD
jgi:hypothetical protein